MKEQNNEDKYEMMGNRDLFALYQSAVHHYSSALVRMAISPEQLDDLMVRIEHLKSIILSRMHSPDIIKLNIKHE